MVNDSLIMVNNGVSIHSAWELAAKDHHGLSVLHLSVSERQDYPLNFLISLWAKFRKSAVDYSLNHQRQIHMGKIVIIHRN